MHCSKSLTLFQPSPLMSRCVPGWLYVFGLSFFLDLMWRLWPQIIWKAYGSMGPAGVEEFIFSVEGEIEPLTSSLNAKVQALEVRHSLGLTEE